MSKDTDVGKDGTMVESDLSTDTIQQWPTLNLALTLSQALFWAPANINSLISTTLPGLYYSLRAADEETGAGR